MTYANFRPSLKANLPFPPAFRFESFLPYLVRPPIRLVSPDPTFRVFGSSLGRKRIDTHKAVIDHYFCQKDINDQKAQKNFIIAIKAISLQLNLDGHHFMSYQIRNAKVVQKNLIIMAQPE